MYFETKKNVVEEINSSELENIEKLRELETKILDLELKNAQLNNKIEESKKTDEVIEQDISENKKIVLQKNEINQIEKVEITA